MATINTVVENLTLPFDMVYRKVTFEGSKEELLERIECDCGLIRFVYEGADRKLHELVTRGENILSLEFPVESTGAPVSIKPTPKNLDERAGHVIPLPIRNRMAQPEMEKPMNSFQLNCEHRKEVLNKERTQGGPCIVVTTPEEFMAEIGMSKEEFIRLISTAITSRPM